MSTKDVQQSTHTLMFSNLLYITWEVVEVAGEAADTLENAVGAFIHGHAWFLL